MKIRTFFSKAFSYVGKLFSLIAYKDKETKDHLEAYPERLHVKALPERRYLKTSRTLVVLALLCLSLNFALGLWFVHNATRVSTVIQRPNGQAHLYTLDRFQRKVRVVEGARGWIGMENLVLQNLIDEYLTLRYTIVSNEEEMIRRWGNNSKLFLYGKKLYEEFPSERSGGIFLLRQGYIQEIYIYSIQHVYSDLYRVYFDLFRLPYKKGEVADCNCLNKTKECLTCLRENASSIRRYMAYMRVYFDANMTTRNDIIKNPFRFNVSTFTLYPQEIRKDDPWTDVDLIKE